MKRTELQVHRREVPVKAVAQPVDAVAERATIKAAERVAAVQRGAAARANAYPLFKPEDDVSAEVRGWQYGGSRVVDDPGPASNGERKITIEKYTGRRPGERIVVRRDRVNLSRNPGS